MKLKTKQELKEEGFKFISVNQDGMEVWARFTGYQDYIQHIFYKEGGYTGDIQVTNYGELCLMSHMLTVLRKDYLKQDIPSKTDKVVVWDIKTDIDFEERF